MIKQLSLILLFLFSANLSAETPFFVPPKPERETLPSGMKLFVMTDATLPTAEIQIYVRGGSLGDPAGKEGLVSLTYGALRASGSLKNRSKEIEERLEFMGASLEMGTEKEFAQISLKLLSKDLENGLAILFELLREPAFESQEVETVRKRKIEALSREAEKPMGMAFRRFPKIIYGSKNPFGRRPTVRSLKKIRRDDLIRTHRELIGPDRMIVAASGDFSKLELTRILKMQTAGWKPVSSSLPSCPPVEKKFKKENWLLVQKGLTQSTILTGHLGTDRSDPDRFALMVMNYILGGSGSLSSRLGDRVRVKEGKAYGIWSEWTFEKEPGMFYVATQTAAEQTGEVLQLLDEMLTQFVQRPEITEEELDRAKSSILRSFFFSYETSFQLVKDLARLDLLGYPENYLEEFQHKISVLTREDLERVIRKYLHSGERKTFVITDPSVKKRLKPFGSFKRVKQ
ncbi:MAG: insulinase family protein [Deltaproteobacteria bacterium]|nr:insulinase family protein [Deltaproteobacteria bacterium]